MRLPEKEIIKNKEKISLDRFFLTRAWLLAINIAMFGFCWGVLSNYLAELFKHYSHFTKSQETLDDFYDCSLILLQVLLQPCKDVKH